MSAPDIIGAQLHSWSRRGALRRLVAKGKVKMIGRYRRRKVLELGERSPVTDAEIVLLEVREQIRARRCRRRLKCTRLQLRRRGALPLEHPQR